MTDAALPDASPLPIPERLTLSDLGAALKIGWRDFTRAPLYGVFFSAVYVIGGLLLIGLGAGTVAWTLTLSLGFPLVAPFAAVGLYEVSRRLEAGAPLDWGGILGVVVAEKDRQIPWMGAIIVIAFLFWTFIAHMLFALVLGIGAAMQFGASWEMLLTPNGLALVAVELAVGGAFAALMFSITVVSLPLLLDREIDFVTASLLSIRTVTRNLPVMALWAAMIAGLLILGMIPAFLGLFVVLPVLGHATWHLYRRALSDPV